VGACRGHWFNPSIAHHINQILSGNFEGLGSLVLSCGHIVVTKWNFAYCFLLCRKAHLPFGICLVQDSIKLFGWNLIVKAYDPKIIANLILDEAERENIGVTNLALQKLLYFTHGIYLTQKKTPLVSGYFEAWQFGPVHPAVYKSFKASGSSPIIHRASSKDPLTGNARPLGVVEDRFVISLVRHVLRSYGSMSPGRLVDLSHAKGSPWDYVVDKARTSVAFGLRITDDVIRERFKNHKVSVHAEPKAGEPYEDSPFT